RLRGPVTVHTAHDAERRSEGIGGLEADLTTAVLVPSDARTRIGHPSARLVVGVEVINTQRRELRAPVGQVAGVRRQRLEVADGVERGAPSLVTGRVHAPPFEKGRPRR